MSALLLPNPGFCSNHCWWFCVCLGCWTSFNHWHLDLTYPPADRLRFPGLKCMRVPSWELTCPPKKALLSRGFCFSQGGICDRSLEGTWWSQDVIPPISASEIDLKNCRWIIYVQKIGCMERFDYLWRHIHLVSNFRVLEGKGLFCFHKTALFIMVISSRKNY